MIGIIGIKFSERGRNVLCSILVWLCIKCLITALINISFGVYFWLELHQHPKLIKTFHGDSLTLAFILSFMFAFLLNVVKIKISMDFHSPYARLTWVPHINLVLALNWLLTYGLLALGSLCFYAKRGLRENLDGELGLAMQNYRIELDSKVEMDRVQIDFHCCGKESYRDWFNVTWLESDQAIFRLIFAEAIDSLQKETIPEGGGIHKMVDNVPWSCCDPVAIRPCVHYGVHHNNLHYNYDFERNNTLHPVGCLNQLTSHIGDHFFQYIIISSSVIGSIESLTLLLLMYLKSAVFESIKNVDLFGDSMGYFMGGACLFRDIKSGYQSLLEMKAENLKLLMDPRNIQLEQAYRQWKQVSNVINDKFGQVGPPDSPPKGKRNSRASQGIGAKKGTTTDPGVEQGEPLVPMSIVDVEENVNVEGGGKAITDKKHSIKSSSKNK